METQSRSCNFQGKKQDDKNPNFSAEPDGSEEDLIIGFSAFQQKISKLEEAEEKRKRLEERTRESDETYRSFLHHAQEAVYILQDGVAKLTNPRTLALTGYSAEELACIPFNDLVHPDDREIFTSKVQCLTDEGNGSGRFTLRFMRRSGEEFWVRILAMPFTWKGRPASLHYLQDITAQKELEAQLQQARKMEFIGTLAGGIAHDFNNLLAGIQGYVSLLLYHIDVGHPHFEYLKKIEENVQNGAVLTTQLLSFTERGKYKVKLTDLNKILKRIAEMCERMEKKIRIFGKYEKDLWPVEVDRGQVEQVLVSLYLNAWHSMPQGGDLYLETKNIILGPDYITPFHLQLGDYVKISVTDTGKGFDEKGRQGIFGPGFAKEELIQETDHLSLAAAASIVKNYGGYLNVYSQKGHGTTQEFYLPASSKRTTENKLKSSRKVFSGTETILLVDDEETIINVVEKALTLAGYKVLCAKSGEEAIEVLRRNPDQIKLVLLDMIMTGLSGQKTYGLLKAINPKVRVILSSGYSFNNEAAQTMDQGCDGFIQKPFGIQELTHKIREILDRSGAVPPQALPA